MTDTYIDVCPVCGKRNVKVIKVIIVTSTLFTDIVMELECGHRALLRLDVTAHVNVEPKWV